jgi:DNA polymerase III delta prime subunit
MIGEHESVRATFLQKYGDGFTFHLIYPEELRYKVSEIKKLTARLARKSTNQDKEDVYVLMQSDGMSAICQNALLKTLEDSNYSLMLVVKNVDSLLATVKSRCITEFVESAQESGSTSDIILSDYDDIASVAKLERDKVKAHLEHLVHENSSTDLSRILIIEEALRKLDANCKVESVLYEMIWRLKQGQ